MAVAPDETRFPCETCGSDLRFNPDRRDLTCDHCGNHQEIALAGASPLREQDYRAALTSGAGEIEEIETQTAKCPNCAAEISFDAGIHAQECPFCATPLVVGTAASRQIKPQAVVPFALDERGAREAMTDWLGRLWFAPSGLQDFARKGRAMDGLYVPYWTYDADTSTNYSGARGTVYYETRHVTVNGKPKTTRVAKTRWRNVSGRVARNFDDILVLASRSLPKPHTDKLAPWDLSALHPFDPQYLAGFRSESYGVELDDGFVEARDYMDRMISRDIRFDIGGDKQRISRADTQTKNVSFKHVLLPIWVAAYKYRGGSYRIVVNGQTGTVTGARPYSTVKIAIAVVLGIALAAAVGFFVAQSQ
ncbi:MAG: primosomal protein N' (replication factor Y) - superfamily II helicase [Pseudomonadota bacterium]